MSKPDDIPQDVWDAARKPAKIACAPHNTPFIAHAVVARAIMAAVEAEREGCAQVANSFPGYMQPRDVAAAIRQRGTP